MQNWIVKWCLGVTLTFLLISPVHAAITVMPLGDSIVAGYDGAPMAGYRQELLNDLTSQGIQIQYQGVYDPTPEGALGSSAAMTALGQNYITAFGGFTSADILNNLNGSVPSPGLSTTYPFTTNHGGYWMIGGNGTGRAALDPNVVLFQIGTNDAITAFGGGFTLSQTEQNIESTLEWFETNRPGTTIFLASPPPAVPNGQAYVQEIADFTPLENAWMKTLTTSEFPNTRYVDEFDAFLNPDGSVNSTLLSSDGVHPSDAGYQVIANLYDSAIVSSVPEPSFLFLLPFSFLLRRTRLLLV